MKLLKVGRIYQKIAWVSLVHVVDKKGDMVIIRKEKNELIPIHMPFSWRIFGEYVLIIEGWILAIMKGHFPLPFMDHMLEIL